MATNFAALRKEFLARLADMLGPLGFRRSGRRFHRKTPHGHEAVDVSFLAFRGKAFGVNLHVGVRYDAVEQLSNEFSPRLPPKLRRWTTTIGNRLDNLYGQSERWTWYVCEESELETALTNVMQTVRMVVLPYFKRFASLESTLDVLARDDEDARRHCVWKPTQAKHAVAAAFVLGRRELFEEIAARKLRLLQQIGEGNEFLASFIPEVRALVNELRSRWTELEDSRDMPRWSGSGGPA